MNLKNFFIVVLFLCASLFTYAQKSNGFELISSKSDEIIVKFQMINFDLVSVETSEGKAYNIAADNSVYSLLKDAPQLPKFTTSFVIPNKEKMKAEIIDAKFYDNNEQLLIAPSKGNITRDIDPATIPYVFGKIYKINEFYPKNIAQLDKEFIIRDFRGQTLALTPFQYNPVSKTLRVYTEITVKITTTNQLGENILTGTSKQINSEFSQIYSDFFINYSAAKYQVLSDEGEMLIICHDPWVEAMQEFVTWKNQKGIKTTIIPKSQAGANAAAIKEYVKNYYQTSGLTFLLLVGDAQYVPVNTGSGLGGDSDNAYAYIDGNDHYQEFFVGRFSAESLQDVETQIRRTVDYEKAIGIVDGWLNNSIGIGSEEGPGDDNEYDYAHMQKIQNKLKNYTYLSAAELYDGSQGGTDESGDATAAQLTTAINNGASIINYIGHGSSDSFVTTGFDMSDINNLDNANKLPFIWSVACVNGEFVGQTCFAETWLRAKNAENKPTGALAVIMSTINQSWNPPMEGQDEMVEILVEGYQNNIKRSFGGLAINGCFKMNETYGTDGNNMTDTWTIFGDPSVIVRTDNAVEMTIVHADVIIIGAETFDINCNTEGAIACLSKDGQIITTAKVTNLQAKLSLENILPGETLDLVITAYNTIPYIIQIMTVAPEGAYIVASESIIADINGNNNAQAEYGETFNLNISLKNVGVENSSANIIANISSESLYIKNITNNTFDYQIINKDEIKISESAFTVELNKNIPDNTIIEFVVNITDGTNEWTSKVNVKVNAPKLVAIYDGMLDISNEISFTSSAVTSVNYNEDYNYFIEVLESVGNNNGRLDAGESVIIKLKIANQGHADLTEAVCLLSSQSEYITINTQQVNILQMTVNQEITNGFNISVNENTPIGTIVDLKFEILFSEMTQQENIILSVGLQTEDFEIGDLTNYNWLTTTPKWTISSANAQEGTYCVKSGGSQTDNAKSNLSLDLNVMADSKLSFYFKVSSEEDWDFLRLYIDNQEKQAWSGEIDWTLFEIDVPAGEHSIKWSYEKDETYYVGDDCAWLDNIILPVHSQTTKKSAITFETNTLPQWLSLTDNNDGTATLSGKAPAAYEKNDIEITAKKDDKSISQKFILEVGTYTSISEIFTAKLYPNPAADCIYLESEETINYTITDLTGRILLSNTTTQQINKIDISNLSSGSYIFTTITTSNRKENKIIVIR